MPIYEYQCATCGTIEVTQRITDKALSKCPTCKSKVKRLISNTSFQLKGTGWYITDYARKGQTNGDSKSDSGSKDASSAESKGESKKGESKKIESKKSESSTSDKSSSTASSSSSSTSA